MAAIHNSPAHQSLFTDVLRVSEHLSESREQTAAQDWLAKNATQIRAITKLPGDASTRQYYRLEGERETFILMSMESFTEHGQKLPFLAVQKHLKACEIDVPDVLAASPEKGLILLEDLGDVTLLRRLQDVSSADIERHLYQKVLDQLVRLQVLASPRPGAAELDAFKLCFDFEKLMWEVGFTIEHFYEKHLKREIRDRDRKVIQDGFSEICRFLAEQPTVLAHRDFHSRNIMVTSGADGTERLVMIDFQDARLGPAQYDLVSLLKDSYYQLEESQIRRLIDYYIARREALSGERINLELFYDVFDMMSVQRCFKAIGSFASFLNRRGNPTYLKFIGNTFESIRRVLLKHPRFSELREVLFHYYYF
ncbi:MAG TPA: phosphotransferase [Bdellovibrionota bacterium]|nr:phosphotransferase [Bdellovibrionota bacterium]